MFKRIALASLLLAALVIPSLTLAEESDNRRDDRGARAELKLNRGLHLGQIKRKMDVQVSLMGKVTAVNGTQISLAANNGSTYTVDASAARIIKRFGARMTVADTQVNDQLFVKGTLTGSTVKARLIQDFSLQARNASFEGTIQSIGSGSFVLETKSRGLQTIFVSASTTIMKNGSTAAVADLAVGVKVQVSGVWNNTNNNVTAEKIRLIVQREEARLNGTVTSNSTNTLNVAGNDGKTYVVNTSEASLIARGGFLGADFSKVKVNDAVFVMGKTTTSATDVKASLVIDFSL